MAPTAPLAPMAPIDRGILAIWYDLPASARETAFSPHGADGLDESPWTDRVHQRLVHTPVSPFVGPRIWPPVDEHVPEQDDA